MSTRSTIVYTDHNDHIYEETMGTDEVGEGDIVVELWPHDIYGVECDKDGVTFCIRKDTPLYRAFMKLRKA